MPRNGNAPGAHDFRTEWHNDYVQCHHCLKVKRNVRGGKWERIAHWGSLHISGFVVCDRCRNCTEPM